MSIVARYSRSRTRCSSAATRLSSIAAPTVPPHHPADVPAAHATVGRVIVGGGLAAGCAGEISMRRNIPQSVPPRTGITIPEAT